MGRLLEIDDIRGISIFVMILIHTNAYFMADKIAFFTLEISQFAVVAFIFCSSYLFYLKYKTESVKEFMDHFVKRVKRLVIPYYIFFAVYILFVYLKEPAKLTADYVVRNLTFTGGLDFNWLVLLFIELAILMPLFKIWDEKHKKVLYVYIIVAVISSIIFLKYSPHPLYRYIMWLPWSLIVIYTMFFDRIRKHPPLFWGLTSIFLALFLISRQYFLIPLGHSLRQYDNKYPPNLYHLSYCLVELNILYFLAQRGVFAITRKYIHFLSLYSYQIYFLHLLVIFTITVFYHFNFNWVTFFLATLSITSILQFVFNKTWSIVFPKKVISQ